MGGRRCHGPAPAQEDRPPMQQGSKQRRPRGTGHLKVRRDAAGRRTYYGKYHVHGRQVLRALGPARHTASRVGWEKPRVEREQDIRFLDIEELEALIRAVPDDELGALEAVLYRTAAMTGMRRGELLALRWRDVDWAAGVVRVRRNYSRGEMVTPKT